LKKRTLRLFPFRKIEPDENIPGGELPLEKLSRFFRSKFKLAFPAKKREKS
jgi:hypothetical protein